MGQSTPINRDIVFTDASLTVAAARHAGAQVIPEVEAERILRAYPTSGVTKTELAQWITERIDLADTGVPVIGMGRSSAAGDGGNGSLDLPRDRSNGE
jgi:hypothetical protein